MLGDEYEAFMQQAEKEVPPAPCSAAPLLRSTSDAHTSKRSLNTCLLNGKKQFLPVDFVLRLKQSMREQDVFWQSAVGKSDAFIKGALKSPSVKDSVCCLQSFAACISLQCK